MSVLIHAIIVSFILQICVSVNNKDAQTHIAINEHNPDGSYYFRYFTSNGIAREETGTVVGEKDKAILKVKGSYSYPNSDGSYVRKTYEADENGYKVSDVDLGRQAFLDPLPNPDPNPIPTLTIMTLMGGGLSG